MSKVLCLSGGSVRGSYQIGVLKHLLGERKEQYDGFVGISVGAINASFLSQFPAGDEKQSIIELEELWRSLKTTDVYKNWTNWPKPFSYVKAFWNKKSSLYNSQPLVDFIHKTHDLDCIRNSGKKLRVGAFNLSTGEYEIFNENNEDIISAVLASASFPGMFCPIEINGNLYIDGGVRKQTPLKCAIELGATDIDVILTSPKRDLLSVSLDDLSIIKLGQRLMDILSADLMNSDLEKALKINKLIRGGANIPFKRELNIRVFRPKDHLIKSSFDFNQDNISSMIDKGYYEASQLYQTY